MFLIRDAEPRILIEDIGAFDVGARPFYFWVNAQFTAASKSGSRLRVIRLYVPGPFSFSTKYWMRKPAAAAPSASCPALGNEVDHSRSGVVGQQSVGGGITGGLDGRRKRCHHLAPGARCAPQFISRWTR